MNLVSIVMPVYNGELYLRESIESVINQTFQNWELIVVNDCSTDRSLEIVQEYMQKDRRIRVISNPHNLKLPTSLNVGFREAAGKYLTWTSDDNIFMPDAIEIMLELLEKKPEMGLVYCDMYYIDDQGKITGQVSTGIEQLPYNDCIGACFLYRREILKTVGEYSPEMFLVEDYEYWLRVSQYYKIYHLPEIHYYYRRHQNSLTGSRAGGINRQLFKLRLKYLDFLLEQSNRQVKAMLFLDFWFQNREIANCLRKKFFPDGILPEEIRWIERGQTMDSKKQIILYGAGDFGKKALDYFGSEKVAFFADGNQEKSGTVIEGKRVISRDVLQKIHQNYNIVISVDARKAPAVADGLEELGIQEYTTYLELAQCLKKPEEKGLDWYKSFMKATDWIKKHSIPGQGIINNTDLRQPYPEVTGYYIPSLLNWGFRDLAITYAKWLCSIQRDDGSWCDTDGKEPYIFDTAQILKGLLSVRDLLPDTEKNIRKGCQWILSQMQDNGCLVTPSTEQWDSHQCSDLIHLYCISPLIEAGYKEEARHIANYYIQNRRKEILDFSLLSHFYAYVMEALCDIGETELARQAMEKIGELQREDGLIPAYKNVNWVCSTGLIQFAVVWYKLGDVQRGNMAFNYALGLQNESGGWFGSYPTSEHPKGTDWKEYPDYFPKQEISWAVKYFLDALYYKCKAEFEIQSSVFPETIDKRDGRYQFILGRINQLKKGAAVLDAGCGKGRYLKNLLEDVPGVKLCGVDLSENVTQNIPLTIEVRQGSLCKLPYPDTYFELVYAIESLEHAIAQENAVKELLRITKPGGYVVIIDKNQTAMGLLEVDSWEKWFADEFFEGVAKEAKCNLEIQPNISYEDGIADGLFNGWVLQKEWNV